MDEAFFNMLYDVWQENPPESAWRTIDLFFLAKSGEAFTPASLAKRWGISETKAEVILFGLKGMLAQRGLLRS
jgi:hypothetical protein